MMCSLLVTERATGLAEAEATDHLETATDLPQILGALTEETIREMTDEEIGEMISIPTFQPQVRDQRGLAVAHLEDIVEDLEVQ